MAYRILTGFLPLFLLSFSACLKSNKSSEPSGSWYHANSSKPGNGGNGQGFGGGDVILTALNGVLKQMKFSLALIAQGTNVDSLCTQGANASLSAEQRLECQSLLRIAAPEIMKFIPSASETLFAISTTALGESSVRTPSGPSGKILLYRAVAERADSSVLTELATLGLLQKIAIPGLGDFLTESSRVPHFENGLALMRAVGVAMSAYSLMHPETSGGVWSPASIGKIAGWLKVDSLHGRYREGDPVPYLNDVTGNRFNATETRPERYPVYRESVANGYPGLDFSYGHDFMLPDVPRMSRTLLIAECPINFVFSVFSVGSAFNSGSVTPGSFALGSVYGVYGVPNSNTPTIDDDAFARISYDRIAETQNRLGNRCRLLTLVMSRTQTKYFLNGELRESVNIGLTDATSPVWIGDLGAPNPQNTHAARFLELLMYQDALSDQDRAQAERYLKEKYNLY